MIKRDTCIICNSKKLSYVYCFEKFPIHMSVYNDVTQELNIKDDMIWEACDECNFIQLKNLIEPDILYKKPHNPAIGKTWEKHNLSFSDFVKNYDIKEVVEIGGANLKLANLVINDNIKNYNIVDFSSGKYQNQKLNKKIKLIQSSFEDYKFQEDTDAIILSHTFEHFYDPGEFLEKIYHKINNNCRIFISIPNIENQLKEGFLNALNFEHTFYINDSYMEQLFNKKGFIVESKKDFSKYNLFYTIKKDEKLYKNNNIYFNNAKEIFLNFIEKNKEDVLSLNLSLKNKYYYVFGAHVFTQFLFYFGLNKNNFYGILDNDPNKIGQRLCGVDQLVYNPEVIKNQEKPIIIVRTSQYCDEIKEQLIGLNNSCIIL